MYLQQELFHIRKQKRKYIRKKIIQYNPTDAQIQRLLTVKKLYIELKTLSVVAKKLHLTRERVRQLLRKGEEYNLFKYEPTRERQFKDICDRISSSDIVNALANQKNRFEICELLNLSLNDYFKLLKHYQIDTQDYLISARLKKYLIRYSAIVDTLGHHPSTTEMQSITKWRATYAAIERLWGSIDNFRNEFGIEKPPYALHPNSIFAFNQAREKAKQRKLNNIYQVERIIISDGPISASDIRKALGFKSATMGSYIQYLLQNEIVKKIGKTTTTRYVSNKM